MLTCVSPDNENTFLMGDLNYDYKSDNPHNKGRLNQIEVLYDMKSHTRVTLITATLIDVILIK